MHVFKYSKRAGTAAARRPEQVSEEVKHERSERAIALATELSERFAEQYVGTVREVLIEERCEDGWVGYTNHYIRTLVEDDPRIHENRIVKVQMKKTVRKDGEIYLTGVIADGSEYKIL